MTSRNRVLGTLVLLPMVVLVLVGCGGHDTKKGSSTGQDRSHFVAITAKGLAAIVDEHLGDRVKAYSVYADEAGNGGKLTERSVLVRLKGVDPRDTFQVTVYPPGGSQGQVAKGACSDNGAPTDPKARTACSAAPEGGNVTITQFKFGLSDGNDKGTYLTASGSGPTDREATAAYESFTKKMPLSDKELDELLGDPDLGWKTDPKVNKAGASVKLHVLKG